MGISMARAMADSTEWRLPRARCMLYHRAPTAGTAAGFQMSLRWGIIPHGVNVA